MRIAAIGEMAMYRLFSNCYRKAYHFFTQPSGLTGSEYAIVLGLAVLIVMGSAATMGLDIAHAFDLIGELLEQDNFHVID